MGLALAPCVNNPDLKQNTATRPIKDEWGIYDPDQAGFAAILRKIREGKKDKLDSNPSSDRA